MRYRLAIPVVLIALMALGLVARSPHIGASDSAMASHPFVGTWLIDTDTDDPANAPDLIVVHGDGTYTEFATDSDPGAGTWQSTGDSTADLAIWFPGLNDDGSYGGMVMV